MALPNEPDPQPGADLAHLASVIEFSRDAIISKTLAGIVTSWNQGAERLFGYSRQEMIGVSINRLIPRDRWPEEEGFQKSLKCGEVIDQFDTVRLRKDGTEVHVSVTITPLLSSSGQVIGAAKIARDISDRRRAELERDQFFALSLDLLAIAGTDGYFKRMNPAFEETLGFTPEELTAEPFMNFIHPDDLAATLAEVNRLAQGVPTVYFDNRYRCKNGSYRWLAWRAMPDGKTGLIYCTGRDITTTKERESALEEAKNRLEQQEELYRTLVNSLPRTSVALFDEDLRYVTADGVSLMSSIGLQREQMIGRTLMDIAIPANRAGLERLYRRALAGHESMIEVWREGRAIEVHAVPIMIAGKALGLTLVHDVTDRKQMEDQVRASEATLAALFDSSTDSIWALDREGRLVRANRTCMERYQRVLGASPEIGAPLDPRVQRPADSDRVLRGESFNLEKTVPVEGTLRTYSISLSPIRTGDEIIGIAAFSRDITDRKQAEERLIISEARLAAAQELAQMGSMWWDPETREVIRSPQVYKIFGLDPAGPVRSVEGAIDSVVHPDDRQRVQAWKEESRRTGIPFAGEFRIIRPSDGAVRFIQARGRRMVDGDTGHVIIDATMQDITEHKKTEEALQEFTVRLERSNRELKQSQAEFRDVIEKLPVCISIRKGETFVYANPALASMLGYDRPEEIVGKSIFDIAHAEDRGLLQEALHASSPDEKVEVRLIKRSAEPILVQTPAGHIQIPFEGDAAFLTSFRDITDEKRAAEILQTHAREMQALSLIDEMTQLYNRRGFLSMGSQYLKSAKRNKQSAVVLFVDLDGLKQINDQLGHEAGDTAIMATAEVLRSTFRESDILGRLGGDEFVVLAGDCSDPRKPISRLTDAVAVHNSTAHHERPLSLSIGAAIFIPETPEPLEALMQRADVAMYEAKRARSRGNPRPTRPKPTTGRP